MHREDRASDSGKMLDDPITAIARFMIEKYGLDAASTAETFAAEHIEAQEDEGAKLWADVAEEVKRIVVRPRDAAMRWMRLLQLAPRQMRSPRTSRKRRAPSQWCLGASRPPGAWPSSQGRRHKDLGCTD
jgi:hypothetical protein